MTTSKAPSITLPLYGGGELDLAGALVRGFCVVERNGAYMANAIHVQAVVTRYDPGVANRTALCDAAIWWDRYRTPPCFVAALVDARSFTGKVTVL